MAKKPDKQFEIHPRLARTVAASRESLPGEPVSRRLRIFTSDPTASKLEGSTTVAKVPYEPLTLVASETSSGYEYLCGQLFELHMVDDYNRALAPPLLDEPAQLMQDGYAPSESDPRFHAQMVYAVASRVHTDFRRSLGREPGWGFAGTHQRLKIFPLGTSEENAWYDPERGELVFGYFERKYLGWISTALMHDIIAHELTHALLDSQRPHFMEPTGPDVAGFHEGFADLIALFQHFQYPQPLKAALAESGGVLFARHEGERSAHWLCRIARQFGAADDLDALRRADRKAGTETDELTYSADLEEHDMGELLLSAVFDAFDTVFRRRTARLKRLSTGGSGLLPPGAMHPDLLDELAGEAASLARRFLAVTVRALDYCPPASIQLGEFLRAMITADKALVPEDEWGFREALIDAFRVRRIFPWKVFSLTEDSLVWNPPHAKLKPVTALSFAETRFDGGPGRPLLPENRLSQAEALGHWLMHPDAFAECGLVAPDNPELKKKRAKVSRPCIDALEVTSYASPVGEMHFHTVAVVTQRCTVVPKGKRSSVSFQCGGTLIFDTEGYLQMAVVKSALGENRIERRVDFLAKATQKSRGRNAGQESTRWIEHNGELVLQRDWLRQYHLGQRSSGLVTQKTPSREE